MRKLKKRYPDGGKVDPPNKGPANFKNRSYPKHPILMSKEERDAPIKDQKKFLEDYLGSQLYVDRLKKQGYNDPEGVRDERLKKLREVTVLEYPHRQGMDVAAWTNMAEPDAGLIHIDYGEMKTFPMGGKEIQPESIKAHEASHIAGAYNNPYKTTKISMNKNDLKAFSSRNKLYNKDYIKKYNEKFSDQGGHDMDPAENKADLDALRYMLYKDKIYDARKDKFELQHLQKAKSLYKDDAMLRKFMEAFSDDDIIYLMNNIAQNNQSNSTLAAKGGLVKYGDGDPVPKRKPIPVSNPNDPRLRAYRDSLNLYTRGKALVSPYDSPNPDGTFATYNDSGKYDFVGNHPETYKAPSVEVVKSMYKDYKTRKNTILYSKNEEARLELLNEGISKNNIPVIGSGPRVPIPIYKKPEQSYIYDPGPKGKYFNIHGKEEVKKALDRWIEITKIVGNDYKKTEKYIPELDKLEATFDKYGVKKIVTNNGNTTERNFTEFFDRFKDSLSVPKKPIKASLPRSVDVDQSITNIPVGGNPLSISQPKTEYVFNYRDENSPSKQNQLYFKSKEEWDKFMNSGSASAMQTSQTSTSASGTGYLKGYGGCVECDEYAKGGQVEYPGGGELPPVTVHGFKKRSTQDFYNYIQNANPNTYYALIKMGEKYGFSTIERSPESKKSKYIKNASATASYYRPDNKIVIWDSNNKSSDAMAVDVLDEMAHKIQYDRHPVGTRVKWFDQDLLDKIRGTSPYENPKSMEYDAHKNIKPKLYKQYLGHRLERPDLLEAGEYGKGGWIQNAVNPAHKGYCTPMTKSTCTPRRKAFARTMKKHHGFHADGGPIDNWGHNIPYLLAGNLMANFLVNKKREADYNDYQTQAEALYNPVSTPVVFNNEYLKGRFANGGSTGLAMLELSQGIDNPIPSFSPLEFSTARVEEKAHDDVLQSFKTGIAAIETPGFKNPYVAQNPHSSAYGKYQFLKGTLKEIYKTPRFRSTYSNFEQFNNAYRTNPSVQEEVMDIHSTSLLSQYKDPSAAAIAFFSGGANAKKYLNNQLNMGVSPTQGYVPNVSYSKYLSIFKKYSGL